MPVLPNAEPIQLDGGRTGVLIVHGFTSGPASMSPWARSLAGAGFTVHVPRLPGHGTTWQEMNQTTWTDWYAEVDRTFDLLRQTCNRVFVAGLSMGGCLALRLAEQRADDVAGLVLVNPSVIGLNRRLLAVPVLKLVRGSVAGIKSDIKRVGVEEDGYDRVPLKALDSLRALWKVTRADLLAVTAPVIVFRSVVDHVVEPLSTELILQHVASRDVTERILDDSYHVAVLDNDAGDIFTESAEFIRKQSPPDDESVTDGSATGDGDAL